MWSVLRRLQGEEYSPACETKGATANLHHIARHSCRSFDTASSGAQLTEPYGLNLYPKLIRTLHSEDRELRVKALEALLSAFGNKHEHVVRAVQYDVVEALVDRLSDSCTTARALAGKCLMHIVSTELGLQNVLTKGFETRILNASEDKEASVAVEALTCLASMDHSIGGASGTEALIAAGCIPKYIAQAKAGPAAVTERALCALRKVLGVKEAFIAVLDQGGMDALASLLSSTQHGVLEQACETAAQLCFFSAGKRAAVSLGMLGSLKPLMSSSSTIVRRGATAAVMAVSLDNEGKKQALETGIVKLLTQLVREETDGQTTMNILKIVTNCAEAPVARTELLPIVGFLKTLSESTNQALAKAAHAAAHKVEWKPGPSVA